MVRNLMALFLSVPEHLLNILIQRGCLDIRHEFSATGFVDTDTNGSSHPNHKNH
jgi:hypothetical protein